MRHSQLSADPTPPPLSSSSAPAAVSKVSGGTATLPACWLLLLPFSRLCDPAGDYQREAWRPVSHRHFENQETAIGAALAPTTVALSLDVTHSATTTTTPPDISTSHEEQ